MQSFNKHRITEKSIDGWGNAYDILLYTHSEDGIQNEFKFNDILLLEDANTIIDLWHTNPNLVYLISKGKKL
jgi:hypothetical protein